MSQSLLPDAKNLSEKDCRRGITILIMSLAKYQGKLYGDNHDVDDCIKAALTAHAEMVVDKKGAVWSNPQFFAPRKVAGGEGIATSKIRNPARPMWT